MCAEKKDFVTIKNSDGTKEHHQKRLILCNISDFKRSKVNKHF